ncbi:unnamed protein product [Tilletia controversa]|nr:unnamed protein product [Tilletia controversa]
MSSATQVVAPPAGTDFEKQPSSPSSQSGSFSDKKKQSSEVSPSAGEYPTGIRFTLIVLACALFIFLVALDQTIVSTAIPVVTNQLYANFSVKWVYLASFAIFEVGSLICALATDSPMFIVGRAIAGLGLAGGYSGSLIIVTMIAPLEVRPLLTSGLGGVYGIGGTIGPIIGGALTSKASWRWCFWLNLFFIPPVGFLIAVCLRLPTRKAQHTPLQRLARIDWLGTALILCSVICLLLVCQWGGITYAWADSRIIGLIVGFVVIGLAFCADQIYQGERATIPLRILKNRTVGFGSLVNFCVAAAYFSLLYFLPIYFQSVQGSSAIRSGVQTLPFIVGVIFSVMATGIMVNKFGLYIPYLIAGTALLSIGSGTLYLLRPDSSQATWVGLQFLAGIGPGMAWMLPFIAASSALAPEEIEVGSAIVIFFQTLGGTIFVSVAQSVFQNNPEDLPAVLNAANQAINKTYLISAVLGALAFITVFGMELNRRVPIGGASFAA